MLLNDSAMKDAFNRTMTGNLRASILVPWCNRDEIKDTLARNSRWFEAYQTETLVLNCGGNIERLTYLVKQSRTHGVRVIDLQNPYFNKSLALNIGIFFSRSTRLFVLDADIVLQSDVLAEAMPILRHRAFVTIRQVFESSPNHRWPAREKVANSSRPSITALETVCGAEFFFSDTSSIYLEASRANAVDGSRSGPGLLIANKKHLTKIAGYNSDLEFWGWEDTDVQLRLRHLLALRQAEVGAAVHISHGDDKRSIRNNNKIQTNMDNLAIACLRYSSGEFRGTLSRDVNSCKKRVIEIESH
jgi:N-terminal domain of galactosyltransferase